MARNLMIQGTMSNAGKSIITAGILRVLKQDGYSVAPFKSQNMALNSYITADGLRWKGTGYAGRGGWDIPLCRDESYTFKTDK